MRKRIAIGILAFSFFQGAPAQTQQTLNLGFEQHEKGYPTGWENFGNKDYKIYTDSVTAKRGKFSVVIESSGETTAYKALAFNLPHNYAGETIRLTGFIKTENVADGYAGLWMRIDPQVAFDNMSNRGITGTTDWKEYEISLALDPQKTDKIVIGGLLTGKGKMWLDDLKVTIDGKSLDDRQLQTFTRVMLPAEKDTAFTRGSNISFPTLSAGMINNLELLGRIWGLLKYHHPAIAKGAYNWDYELFRVLPDYIAAKDNRKRDDVLSAWIDKYGTPPACRECSAASDGAVLKPNLAWIDQADLSTDLKVKLKAIYANRNQVENYYIALQPNIGNPDFTHENAYANMPYPDGGFRLLSVYRYWNMIEYFYPNRHLTDKPWNGVLKEYIPKFLQSKDELQYELAALQMIGELNDTHANLWGGGDKIAEHRGTNFAPFRVGFVENKLVVTDYYNAMLSEASQLKIGDVITHVNGRTIQSIVDSLKPYYPASNEPTVLRDIAPDLLRSPQKSITLKYLSDNQSKEQEITLYERGKLSMYGLYKVPETEKCYEILEGNIGYLTLATIKQADIPLIKAAFKDTKGIIIDIRNYPSFFVPFALGSYFVSQPTPFVKFTQGRIDNPGEFYFTQPITIPVDKNHYRGKLVVLVNEISQSQAEYTTMAFRAGDNCTIVGSTTAGADGNVSPILLPGGLRTMISGIGVYYPNGKETQRIGIMPDITVKPTVKGIRNGKDEVLEKAMEIINR